MHFEELWEKCESMHQNIDTGIALNEVIAKISLYKSINQTTSNNDFNKELLKSKSKILGEILWSITKISMADNINVFKSLNDVLKFSSDE